MAESKGGFALVCVVVVMFLSVLGMWWYTLTDNRKMGTDLAALQMQMAVMKRHLEESQQMLVAIESIKKEVRNAREQTEKELAASGALAGDERLDYLLRLLEADLARRGDKHGGDAKNSGVSARAVRGAR